MAVGRVHLLYGLGGSGKTTLARELVAEGAAVRFTLDEWMLRLYPGLSFDDPRYGPMAATVRELIWTIARQVLQSGIDVVLDWNSWSRERRAWVVSRAAEISAPVVLHRLSVSIDEATERAARRAGPTHSPTRSTGPATSTSPRSWSLRSWARAS